MLVVGLTGGIGSGKSFVASQFQQLGVEIIDADVIAREVVEPGSQALKDIAAHFGSEVIVKGQLDRKKLREIIFKNSEEKAWLEGLLHPLIRSVIKEKIDNCQSCYALLVSPLLLETEQYQLCNRIAVVDCELSQQINRAAARDNSSEQQIQSIVDQQMPRQQRLSKADDIIDNSGDESATRAQVEQLHQDYLSASKINQ